MIELALVISVTGLMLAGLLSSMAGRMNKARAEFTITEMRMILAAGQQYYALHGCWPADVAAEKDLFTSEVRNNAWGQKYFLSHQEGRLWVETDVPQGVPLPQGRGVVAVVSALVNQSRWRMTVPLSYGLTARLYDEK